MSLPSVTLITPTGHRTEGLKLAEKYVARQTYKGQIQWIVVSDDGEASKPFCTMGQEYLQGPLKWKIGFNTQRYNLAEAIPHVKGDLVFILEDDDVYRPEYIEVMVDFLKYAEMVGESDVTYYSLTTPGFKEMNNHRHASLCQTAFRKSYLGKFERAVHSGREFPDLALWFSAREKNHKRLLLSGMNLCIGMKGIFGRAGIGLGHTDNDFTKDTNFIKLKELIGAEDAAPYIAMAKK